MLLLLLPGARAAEAVVWLAEGIDQGRARAVVELVGDEVVELRPLERLGEDVRVAALVDRRVEVLCGGPVAVEGWRQRLLQGRAHLQRLELPEALAAFGLLEAELPCLTELILPGDAFRFHLASVELHFVAAEWNRADPALAAFHRQQARLSAARAAAIGPKVHLPTDTLPDAVELLNQVRSGQSGELPVRVVVVGPPEQVWWNGSPARAEPFEVPPGTQILQLTDGSTRVVAVQVVEVPAGGSLVVWAQPESSALTGAEVSEAALNLARSGRVSMVLAPGLQALAHRRAAYLVTESDGRLKVWAEQGGRVLIKLIEPAPKPDGKPAKRDKRRGSG